MKATTKFLLFIFLCLVINFKSVAQYNNNIFCRDYEINPNDSNKLYFGIENANVLKNNEYFGEFDRGYTVFGYVLNPRLIYYPTSRAKIEAGVHLLKYSGIDDFTTARPVFTFQYNLAKGIDIVMGSLYGTVNHKLIEPVFKFERFYTDHLEDGIQFLFRYSHFEMDAWMSWEKFIFTNDPFQEEFTMAVSSRLIYTKPAAKLRVCSPLQFIYAHKGGQIDASDNPVQSLVNMVGGLNFDYNRQGFVKSVSWHNHYIRYTDVSFSKEQIFDNGNALYSQLFANSDWIDLEAGYWYAERFIAPRGEPLFQCVSSIDSSYYEDERQILTAKFIIHKKIYRGINLSARFESYYDIINSQLDYAYGVQIAFNHEFFMRKIKFE